MEVYKHGKSHPTDDTFNENFGINLFIYIIGFPTWTNNAFKWTKWIFPDTET